MTSSARAPANPDAHRKSTRDIPARQQELAALIARGLGDEPWVEPFDDLRFYQMTEPSECTHGVSEPCFCIIAQGRKQIFLGEESYQYDPAHYMLSTVEMPISSQILEASEDEPFLSVVVRLDSKLVSSVMVEAAHPAAHTEAGTRGLNIARLDGDLLDAVIRLVRLVDSPDDAHFLAPLFIKEIVYRLLIGEQGDRLRQLAVLGGNSHRIAKAIDRLKSDFDQQLRIEDLAKELGMSTSSFHHHFKEVTAMTPLQYQKHLRLQEARRLMLADDLDAASAGFQVGYNDASHFSREYKRLFGQPPMAHVEQLREDAI